MTLSEEASGHAEEYIRKIRQAQEDLENLYSNAYNLAKGEDSEYYELLMEHIQDYWDYPGGWRKWSAS